jgi:hypothetical protein
MGPLLSKPSFHSQPAKLSIYTQGKAFSIACHTVEVPCVCFLSNLNQSSIVNPFKYLDFMTLLQRPSLQTNLQRLLATSAELKR